MSAGFSQCCTRGYRLPWAQIHGSGISVVLLSVRHFKITMPLNARFHSSTAQLSTNNHQLTTARRASCVKTTLAVFFVCFVCFVVANNSWFLITCVAKCYCLPVALRLSVSQSVTARESQWLSRRLSLTIKTFLNDNRFVSQWETRSVRLRLERNPIETVLQSKPNPPPVWLKLNFTFSQTHFKFQSNLI